MIVTYISSFRDRFGVEPICAVLSEHGIQIAPSTYYAHLARPVSAAVLTDAYLADAVVTIHRANWAVYGVRKMWHAMRNAGHQLGRDQVGRLMRIAGVHGAVRGRHHTITTRRDESAPRHPDLVKRDWTVPERPDQLWVADLSYVWTLAGFCYVSLVTDVYSRQILGWRVSASKQTALVSAALQQALYTRRRDDTRFTTDGLVHHSDAGSQYTSLAFTQELIDAGVAGSIGTVGDALDNALMESTIGLLKTEAINAPDRTWTSRSEVEWETARWVHWYNTTRLHSSIDYTSPIEYEQRYRDRTTATPDRESA